MAPHASIGVVGLGKMGRQIARRLHKKGFKVIAWNRSPKPRQEFKRFGGKAADTIEGLVKALPRPRVIWLMLPSGETTGEFIKEFIKLLSPGDTIIDGGNSNFQDTTKRSKELARHKINFLDAGTSGGVWGERNGFSLMVGGDKKVFQKMEPVFRALAAGEGKNYGLVGANGAGHFVKMIHNGIEYGMMEAIGEGLAIINKWNSKINLAEVTRIWGKGSVVSSWLVDLARDIFEKENLNKVVGYVHHLGEGEWTIKTAKKLGVDARVIADSFQVRIESKQKRNQNKFSNKIVALLRNRFGGHEVTRRGGSSST